MKKKKKKKKKKKTKKKKKRGERKKTKYMCRRSQRLPSLARFVNPSDILVSTNACIWTNLKGTILDIQTKVDSCKRLFS